MFSAACLHRIIACHDAGCGLERTSGRILKTVAGIEHGLFADYARAVHLFHMAIAVGDPPVARPQLNDLVGFVGDRYPISPVLVAFCRVGLLLEVKWLDGHFDIARGGLIHSCSRRRP